MKTKLCQMQALIDDNWFAMEESEDAICFKRAIGTIKFRCIIHRSQTPKYYLCKEHYDDLSAEGEEDQDQASAKIIGFGNRQMILISKRGACNYRVTYKRRLL